MCENFISLRLQSVAGEDCSCLTESYMACRSSSSQVIVIERWQIIVDQRIRVQHLERCSQFVDSIRYSSGHHASSFHRKHRTQTFSSRKDAMAHGFMDRDRVLVLGRYESIERTIGSDPAFFESVFEHVA
jgi:glycerol-3-phosphate cytidylyltransferase-like family protein